MLLCIFPITKGIFMFLFYSFLFKNKKQNSVLIVEHNNLSQDIRWQFSLEKEESLKNFKWSQVLKYMACQNLSLEHLGTFREI